MKDLIELIGDKARLEEIAADGFLKHGESKLMAGALLTLLDAQDKPGLVLRPFGYDGETFIKADIDHHAAVAYYTTPPAVSLPFVSIDPAAPDTECMVVTQYHAPDGWKMVPVELTAEMIGVGGIAFDDCEQRGEYRDDAARRIFRAMLSAVPMLDDAK